jgi:hypothetical protein
VSDPLNRHPLASKPDFAGYPSRFAITPEQPARVYVLTRRPGHLFCAHLSRMGTDAFVRPAQPKASSLKLETLKMSEKTFVLSVV